MAVYALLVRLFALRDYLSVTAESLSYAEICAGLSDYYDVNNDSDRRKFHRDIQALQFMGYDVENSGGRYWIRTR